MWVEGIDFHVVDHGVDCLDSEELVEVNDVIIFWRDGVVNTVGRFRWGDGGSGFVYDGFVLENGEVEITIETLSIGCWRVDGTIDMSC